MGLIHIGLRDSAVWDFWNHLVHGKNLDIHKCCMEFRDYEIQKRTDPVSRGPYNKDCILLGGTVFA